MIMKQVTLYIAQSLDGFVASTDGSVSWLDEYSGPDSDYGFEAFVESIDTVVQGHSTFRQFPVVHPGKHNYVFSREPNSQSVDGVTFVAGSTRDFVDSLDEDTHKHVWLVGGPGLLTGFLNEDQVDEMIVFVMPVLLREGIPLFSNLTIELVLSLIDTTEYSNGVVRLHYKVEK
jgi:dihydrofolate reductase